MGPPNVHDPMENLSTMRSMYARLKEESPAAQGSFELTCKKLFGVDVHRLLIVNQPAVEAAAAAAAAGLAEYMDWELASVQVANKLPLEFSEAVYNFARIQQFTRAGRRGLPIPQPEKRKRYATECFSFLSFCKLELHLAWAQSEGGWQRVWVEFLKTVDRQDRESRNNAIGKFIQTKNNNGKCVFSVFTVCVFFFRCVCV